jgi:UDP-N-acetylmuramate dehydrogenase
VKRLIDFSKYSSIKIGNSIEVEMIDSIGDYKEYYIIGGANNLLVSDTAKNLAILSKEFDYIKQEDNRLIIGGATPSGKVVSYCKKNNIKNFEVLSHLPGTIGGIVKMNAGMKEYEIFNNLISIKTHNEIVNKKDIEYGYRYTNIDSIIYEAIFEIESGFDSTLIDELKNMRKNQPKNPSAGSCFKNPSGDYAGRLIQEVGLKGYKIGDASFSDIHANFLVNLGSATYKDAKTLIDLAKYEVNKKFNIMLEEEIIVV